MATAAGQRLKLEMSLKSFEANVKRMRGETLEEAEKTLKSGASSYATSASKHTPPSLGRATIDPVFYSDGFFVRTAAEESEPKRGRRAVYDLAALVKDSRVKFRGEYGKRLRQGFRYMVKIFRTGKKPVRKYCRTEAEAAQYAHETYRGLTRAAWGLQFALLTGKVPPAFRKYLAERPELNRMAGLNQITMDRAKHEIRIVNGVIPAGASYLASTDTNASIAAVRTMDDSMNKFFKRKYEL